MLPVSHDGVLVTRRVGVFEDGLLRNLKKVVDSTGAQIVLSSDWRRHPYARAEASREMAKLGLGFISCTPCMSQFVPQRPTEIMTWRRDFARKANTDSVSHWVAIDDRALLEERHGTHLRGHFVQTHPLRGLTEAAADECIKILNREKAGSEASDDGHSEFMMSPLPRVGLRGCADAAARGMTPARMRSASAAAVNPLATASAPLPGATRHSTAGALRAAPPRSQQRGMSLGATQGVRRQALRS